MSQGVGYTNQFWCRNNLSELKKWYNEKRDKGFFLTSVAYNGNKWTFVVSKTDKISTQGWFWAKNNADLESQIKKTVWDRSLLIHAIEYSNGKYLVFYGDYLQNKNRGQGYQVDPSNVSESINKSWNDSYYVAYIGGGYQSQLPDVDNRKYGQRTGDMWFVNEGGQQAYFKFSFYEGKYLAESSTQGMGTPNWLPRYVMRDETADSYLFYDAQFYYKRPTHDIVVISSTPKLIVSKNWDKITIKNNVIGDVILTKEVSKDVYDMIMVNKREEYGHLDKYDPIPSQDDDYSDNNINNNNNSTCPDCYGKGYRPQAYDYAAGSSFAPYHNHYGNECFICERKDDHYHYRCTTCKKW